VEVNDFFYVLGWPERVHEDGVVCLPDTIYTVSALDEPDDGPRQVVVYDDVAVLKVLAFGQDVGGNKNP